MRTKETKVYTFDELSERVKEKARDWYREGALDYDWWEFTYDDAATIGAILGLDLAQKPVKLMNGSTRYDTEIYFSGFYQLAQENPELYATVKPNGDTWLTIEVTHGETRDEIINNLDYKSAEYDRENEKDGEREEALTEALKDFNHWIFKQLESEYEWQNADEQVDESIRANEYEFTEDGEIA